MSAGDGSFVSCSEGSEKERVLMNVEPSCVALHGGQGETKDLKVDKDPTVETFFSFLPWNPSAEPCILVTVHNARDLPWHTGFKPPDTYCKMHSEFRLRETEKELKDIEFLEDLNYACPSKLPHIDRATNRDDGAQEKISETFRHDQ